MENRYQAVAKVTRVLSEDYEPQGEEDREGDLQKKKQRMQTKVSVQSKAKDLGQKQGVLEFSYVLCEKREGEGG